MLADKLRLGTSASAPPEFIASASAIGSSLTEVTVSKPTGTVQGDLMIAFMSKANTVTWTQPSGWTEVADQGSNPSIGISYKVAGASEPSSYIFQGGGGSGNPKASIITYRGAAFDVIGSFATLAMPISAPSIDVSENNSVLLAMFARGSSDQVWSTPAGMTSVSTSPSGGTPSYLVASEIVDAGATGVRTSSIDGATSAATAAIMLSIKPA